jgi:hypothetical protein
MTIKILVSSLLQFFLVMICGAMAGCMQATPPSAPKKPPTTDKIGEFDPAAGKEVVTPDAKVTDPITGPLEVLKSVRMKLPALQIEHAVNLFNASEGRYPQSHEEFMTRIIQENQLRLPQLPAGLEYQYDVTNHKLVIIRTDDGKVVE